MLALAIGAAPAAIAADPTPTVKTIVSGAGTGVAGTIDPNFTYAITNPAGASGDAKVVAPNSRWSAIPGLPAARWINTTGSNACGQGCGSLLLPVTTRYSTSFLMPEVSSASISIDILADNSAVSIELNGVSVGAQPGGDYHPNYQTVTPIGPVVMTTAFRTGPNTLTIDNQDFGGSDGIDIRATISYVPAPLTISFVADNKGYNGTTAAQISSCSIVSYIPIDQDVTCDYSDATASFADRDAGDNKNVTGSGFKLSGANAGSYTIGTVQTAKADISKAPLTVTAVANVKTADGNTGAAEVPDVTGTIYSPDTKAFTETYDTAAAGSGKTLTPAGVVNDGNDGNNYDPTFVNVSTGRIRPAGLEVINPATGKPGSIAFGAQPIDTQVSTPIYSNCVPVAPGTAVGGTPPCVKAPTSSPVTVTAKDAFGNLAGPGSPGADAAGPGSLNPPITITIKETGQTASLGTAATSNGVATFVNPVSPFDSSLVIGGTRASTTLAASTTPSLSATSSNFRVVSDLAACDGQTCDSLAKIGDTGSLQKSYGRITTSPSNDFFIPGSQNVILTTQFSTFEKGQCAAPSMSLGQTSEVRVDGTGVTPTSPAFSVTLIYPKETIKKAGLTARNADSYDVCLGATWLGAGTPTLNQRWQAKNLATGALQPSVVDTANSKLFWGWVPMCSAIQSSNLTPDQKAANPCITLRTKQAATLKAELVTKQGMTNDEFIALGARDSDVMIVVSKPWPWDGKFGTGLK